jgi:hypothetical protein
MNYIINRLREPSTYAGLAAIIAAFGLSVPSELFQAVSAAAMGVAGLLAVLLGERSEF